MQEVRGSTPLGSTISFQTDYLRESALPMPRAKSVRTVWRGDRSALKTAHKHIFHLKVVIHAVLGPLASLAGLFDATKRCRSI